MLLKTNRPPTDQEKTIIQESMAPAAAKLKAVEVEISKMAAHIDDLKSQAQEAESKLQRLREQKAAILQTFQDHRRVLSAIRDVPDDVFREIFIACTAADVPTLSTRYTPLPYVLGRISSGLRHIALTTPAIWTRMDLPFHLYIDEKDRRRGYLTLARMARQWLKRADGLPLSLFIEDSAVSNTRFRNNESDEWNILIDVLLSYSAAWKKLSLKSSCQHLSRLLKRISALTAVDLPLLQSVSLEIACVAPNSGLSNIELLKIPTLKHLSISLESNKLRRFVVNWAVLTSVSFHGKHEDEGYSRTELAKIFRQTKCLVFCDIDVGRSRASDEHYHGKIMLPFLKTFYLYDRTFGPLGPSSGTPILTDLITAPVLEILSISSIFLKSALSDFLQKSPKIWKLYLPYFLDDMSLANTIGFLHHCPSLTVLSLHPPGRGESNQKSVPDANMLMRAFIEDSDVGVLCPRLQDIKFTGNIDFSLETLQHFLDGKHSKTPTPGISPWKRVIIDIQGINAMDTHKQILNFVSQKKAEGLQVDAFLEHKKLS